MTDGVFCSQALRADAALQLADISAMRHKTDGELREYRRRFATSRDASQQCDDARVARRVERARRQPRSDEDEKTKVLDGRFISRVVVETYLKRTQLVAAETGHARDITHGAPGLGVLGNDTVFDSLRRAAVETPYFTTALGVSDLSDGDAVDASLDRVIASARYHARRGDAKCAAFSAALPTVWIRSRNTRTPTDGSRLKRRFTSFARCSTARRERTSTSTPTRWSNGGTGRDDPARGRHGRGRQRVQHGRPEGDTGSGRDVDPTRRRVRHPGAASSSVWTSTFFLRV